MRELEPEELTRCGWRRKANCGRPRPRKCGGVTWRTRQLPTVKPKASRLNPGKPFPARGPFEPAKPVAARAPVEPEQYEVPRASADVPANSGLGRRLARTSHSDRRVRQARDSGQRRAHRTGSRKVRREEVWRWRVGPGKASLEENDRGPRPPARFSPDATVERRPSAGKPFGDRPGTGRASAQGRLGLRRGAILAAGRREDRLRAGQLQGNLRSASLMEETRRRGSAAVQASGSATPRNSCSHR